MAYGLHKTWRNDVENVIWLWVAIRGSIIKYLMEKVVLQTMGLLLPDKEAILIDIFSGRVTRSADWETNIRNARSTTLYAVSCGLHTMRRFDAWIA